MKKFLLLSVFFMSLLLIVTPKTHAQVPPWNYHIDTVVINLQNKYVAYGTYNSDPNDYPYMWFWSHLKDAQGNHILYSFGEYITGTDSANVEFAPFTLNEGQTYWIITSAVQTEEDTPSSTAIGFALDSIMFTVPIITGIRNEPKIDKDDFIIYPNPATDALTIEHPGAGAISAVGNQEGQTGNAKDIKIFDLTGNLICATPGVAQNQKQLISVAKFPSGIYFIQIGDKTKRFQVVKP